MKKLSLFFISLFLLSFSIAAFPRTVIQILPVTLKKNYQTQTPANSLYKITEAHIVNGTLRVQVEFKGKNPFVNSSLFWNGAFLKSRPPQVNLHLHIIKEISGGTTKWNETYYFNVKNFRGNTIHLYNGKTLFKSFPALRN